MKDYKNAILVVFLTLIISACEGGEGGYAGAGGNGGGFGGGSGGNGGSTVVYQPDTSSQNQYKTLDVTIGGIYASNDIIEIVHAKILYHSGEVKFVGDELFVSPGACMKLQIPGYVHERTGYLLEANEFLHYYDDCQGGMIPAFTKYDVYTQSDYISSSVEVSWDSWVSFSSAETIKLLGVIGSATSLNQTLSVFFQSYVLRR